LLDRFPFIGYWIEEKRDKADDFDASRGDTKLFPENFWRVL
jgi:hypothetical protein